MKKSRLEQSPLMNQSHQNSLAPNQPTSTGCEKSPCRELELVADAKAIHEALRNNRTRRTIMVKSNLP